MSNKKKGWCGLVTTWRLVISISIQLNVVLLLKYTPCSCQQVIFFTATRKEKKKKEDHVWNRGYRCQNCCNKKKGSIVTFWNHHYRSQNCRNGHCVKGKMANRCYIHTCTRDWLHKVEQKVRDLRRCVHEIF